MFEKSVLKSVLIWYVATPAVKLLKIMQLGINTRLLRACLLAVCSSRCMLPGFLAAQVPTQLLELPEACNPDIDPQECLGIDGWTKAC